MKKLLSLIILPLVALACLFGCGDNRTVADIKKLYLTTVDEYKDGDTRVFFSDESNEYQLYISYPQTLLNVMNNASLSNDVQKRYKGLDYQQKILRNIYAYYTNHYEDFYKVAESKNIDKNTLNDLYNKLNNLNTTLDEFVVHYNTFTDLVGNGVSNVMKYNITRYTYQVNKVIDASFTFMYAFHDVYSQYCVDNYNSNSSAISIQTTVDKAYLDLAYVVYMENIKAFNYSVSENGICDLSGVVANNCEYNLLSLLDSKKTLDETILENLVSGTTYYEETMEKLNAFAYSRDVFEQKLNTYKSTYYSLDMYNVSAYKFGNVSDWDYEDYLQTLSPSKKATVTMLENFVQDNFQNYISKLEEIVK